MALAGCATKKAAEPSSSRQGEVEARLIEPETDNIYAEAKPGEMYRGPFAYDENASPQYPASLLANNLPPEIVRVRVIVDEGGNVTQCLPLAGPTNGTPEFFAAVRAAVLTWRFDPLIKMEGGSGRTTIAYHDRRQFFEGKAIALPFHLDYEFTFSQVDGKGVVSGAKSQ
jgi:TonB family protein